MGVSRVPPPSLIRVAVIDDHEAVRLGLRTALGATPDLEPAGSAGTAAEAAPLLYRLRPDIVLVDYRLPDVDGLTLCRRIKSQPPAPGVVLFSAFADASMTVPAVVAGVDAIIDKRAPTRDLFEAIRQAARGRRTLPEISPPLLEAAAQEIDACDLPLLGMLVHHTAPVDITAALRIDRSELERRITGMLARLTRNELRAVERVTSAPAGDR
jgi:DNA-binding NarL/FixJ family response regulator